MPGQIRVRFRDFEFLDFRDAQRVQVPRRRPPMLGEETLLRGVLEGLAVVAPNRAPRIRGVIHHVSAPPGHMSVTGAIPGAVVRSPVPDHTITLGVTGGIGAGVAYGGGAGVYFWNKRPGGEIGLYGSVSIGVISNIGASIGDQFCLLFGPAPAVLAGDSITVSVEVGVDIFTFAGQLILSAPPVTAGWPPRISAAWTPEIIGVGFAITVGFSALPVDIAVMPGRTWTRPVMTAP